MSQEIRTFKQIQDAVINRAKLEDTTANRNLIKEFINTTYRNIGYEEFYRWSGENYSLYLPSRYTTGTLTATEGSDTVTGASTSWTELNHFGWKIKIGSVNFPHKVVRVASTTSMVLDANYTSDTSSSLTYELYQDEIGLPPDFQDIRKLRIPGLSQRIQPLPCSPENIDILRDASPFRTGWPRYYTIWSKNHFHQKTWADFKWGTDYWEDEDFDDPPTSTNLILWPGIRTEDRYAIIRYTKVLYPLGADTEEPLIPRENREVLVYGTLVEHFLTNRDPLTSSMWNARFKELKGKMASDIETTDDELILHFDGTGLARKLIYYDEDELLS